MRKLTREISSELLSVKFPVIEKLSGMSATVASVPCPVVVNEPDDSTTDDTPKGRITCHVLESITPSLKSSLMMGTAWVESAAQIPTAVKKTRKDFMVVPD